MKVYIVRLAIWQVTCNNSSEMNHAHCARSVPHSQRAKNVYQRWGIFVERLAPLPLPFLVLHRRVLEVCVTPNLRIASLSCWIYMYSVVHNSSTRSWMPPISFTYEKRTYKTTGNVLFLPVTVSSVFPRRNFFELLKSLFIYYLHKDKPSISVTNSADIYAICVQKCTSTSSHVFHAETQEQSI